MSTIPFDNDGFVDMGHFDATDPDLVPALSEHGLIDDVPTLGDTDWDGLLRDVFQSDASADDALVGDDDAAPFDEAETDAGDDDTDADPFHLGVGEDDDSDDLDAAATTTDEDDATELDDLDGSDVGSTAGDLVSFDDDGGDLGSSAGELVSFGDDDEVDFSTAEFDADDTLTTDDDLDALENLDFD